MIQFEFIHQSQLAASSVQSIFKTVRERIFGRGRFQWWESSGANKFENISLHLDLDQNGDDEEAFDVDLGFSVFLTRSWSDHSDEVAEEEVEMFMMRLNDK